MADADNVADLDVKLGSMRVTSHQPVPMIDLDHVSVLRVIRRVHDNAGTGCPDWLSRR